MRQFMAALAALLVALPAAAQTQVVPYNGNVSILTSGGLTTSGDVVQVTISGSQWSTIVWNVVGAAGTATVTAEVSLDGGTNWIFAPYSKKTNLVAGNPSVAFISGTTLATAQVWETPLPSNATNFRLRCSTTGTTTTIQITGGAPYVPGMPVVGVLYDQTFGAGGANNTATLDVSGWREVVASVVVGTAATGAASLNIVDDAGTAVAIGSSASIAVGTYVFGWGDSGVFGTANPFTMINGITALPLDRRLSVLIAGATTSVTRIRVVGRR